jgi:Holliday junction resolvasome RuvABC endonuclease subunit|tara:strand:+ start:1465 stop:1917 length:453 start_codon:yes stop_codon:yes gene_type:complete
MNYLGLDCSSLAVHGAIVNDKEELVSLHKWGSKLKTFDSRFPEITKEFSKELSKINQVEFASIEAAIFIQNPKTTIAIANVIGAVWAFLLEQSINTSIIDNRSWKKTVIGKGNSSKDDIKKFAIEKWGDKFPEQDYADAACVALWNKRRF